jgi:hypothetical protein
MFLGEMIEMCRENAPNLVSNNNPVKFGAQKSRAETSIWISRATVLLREPFYYFVPTLQWKID